MKTSHIPIPTPAALFAGLQCLRLVIAGFISVFISWVWDPGISLTFLLVSSLSGTLMSGVFLKKRFALPKVFLFHGVAIAGLYYSFHLLNIALISSPYSTSGDDFLLYSYWQYSSIILIAYGIFFSLTWLYWTISWAATAEAILLVSCIVLLVSAHRNFNLEAPQALADLAWSLNLNTQYLLIALGSTVSLLFAILLFFSLNRPIFGKRAPEVSRSKKNRVISSLALLTAIALLGALANLANEFYQANIDKASNGVGFESQEGKSPLGFHSAVGKTRQPAALVRLESDYIAQNPWSPMLYIREGALSAFDGHELVNASKEFDQDVVRTPPGISYQNSDRLALPSRKEIRHSVYLLTKHLTPFAIDYPTSIRPIENPDKERFIDAWQAISLAPIVSVEQMLGEKVGSEDWSKDIWSHYLSAPGSRSNELIDLASFDYSSPMRDEFQEDLRYKALSQQLTAGLETPVEKALAITAYLSQKSIYTRNPGHQAVEGTDPVAPYLFSHSMRGYCVHFAHAGVYLMRLAGIPSRIGTGYLTDLSYAKDGHVLLHLGDRHAWPEVFVEGFGWAVFDISPAQAENEPELVPDEHLLEELMSKIDPIEKLLGDKVPKNKVLSSSVRRALVSAKAIKYLPIMSLIALFLVCFLTKLWLRFGYKLYRQDPQVARAICLSTISTLYDLGLGRRYGETLAAYGHRIETTYDLPLTLICSEFEVSRENSCIRKHDPHQLQSAFSAIRQAITSRYPLYRRTLALFSPRSLVSFGRW